MKWLRGLSRSWRHALLDLRTFFHAAVLAVSRMKNGSASPVFVLDSAAIRQEQERLERYQKAMAIQEELKKRAYRSAQPCAVPAPAFELAGSEPTMDRGLIQSTPTGLIFQDMPRYQAIMTSPVHNTDFVYFDPQADMPLDSNVEEAMDQMGPATYLGWLCREYRVDVSPIPRDEYQARRAARIAVRTLKDFPGERFIQ